MSIVIVVKSKLTPSNPADDSDRQPPAEVGGVKEPGPERKPADSALRESEERYRALFERSRDCVFLTDFAGNILDANQATLNLLGYRRDELASLTFASVLSAEQLPAAFQTVAEIKATGYQQHLTEYRLRGKDGRQVDVETQSSLIQHEGKPFAILGIARDITERKRAEAQLKLFRTLVDQANDSFLVVDPETGRLLDVNEQGYQARGYSREEFLALHVFDIDPTLSIDEFKKFNEELRAKGGRVWHGLNRRKDGSTFPVEVNLKYVRLDRDYVVADVRDITERNKVEAELHASEEKYRSLNTSMTEGMALHELVCDAAGQPVDYVLLDANPAFEKLTGRSRAAVIGRRASEIYGGEAPFLDIYAGVAITGRPVNFESAYEPMQKTFAISVFSPAKQRFATVFSDITERKQTEAALRESETEFRAMFELASIGMAQADPHTGQWLRVNGKMCEITGYPADELLRMQITDITHPEDRQQDAAAFQRVIRGEQPDYRMEKRYRRKDGTETWVNVNMTIIRNAAGQPIRTMATIEDITERKQAEAALKEKERLLREAQVIANLGSYMTDFTTGRWSSSEVLDQVFGIGPAYDRSVAGWAALIHPADRAMMVDYLEQEVIGRRQPFNKEYRIIRQNDQAERWVNGLGKLEFDAQGRPLNMVGTIQDITELKRVQESHDRLAMAVEQAAESIVITDTKGTILYANPAFEKITGYTRAEALGQNPRVLKSGKHDAVFYHRMWETLEHGETWSGHFINRRKDGTLYEEEATLSPVRDAAGKVVNYVAVKRDVTHEVELETQIRQAQKMEAIGKLAGGVAHDFNNILAIISMQASLLKNGGNLSAAQMNFADEIGITVDRAAALTRQLLLFSRRKALQLRDLDWSEAVTDTTKLLRRILRETIEVQFHLAAEPMFIHADAGMMDQVLMNLAVNARDAMPAGGRLVIETTGVEIDEFAAAQSVQARPGSFVCLSVTDTGGGIPPEVLPRIFEPFFTTKGVGQGTGLGLATVFGIVQQHKGWIDVHTEVGQGTTFKVYLPRLIGMCDKIIAQKLLTIVPTGKETILLVEDETALRNSVNLTLTRLGYRVLEASTGINALELWQKKRDEISLLLTDLVMPDALNGKDLAQRLLQDNPKLKVIYMSGYSAEVIGRDFPLVENVNFLTKPFQTHKLAHIIRNSLDKPA